MTAKDYYYSFGRYLELSVNLPCFTKIEERFSHLYTVGLSGMGKSTAMENLAVNDISQGYSVIFIDPKGDSAQKLYYHFKDNPKVRYVSLDNPITVNLFNKKGFDFDTLVGEFVQIMDNVIKATSSNPDSSVRMKEIAYHALSALQPEDRNFPTLYKFLFHREYLLGYLMKHHTIDYEIMKWWQDLFNPKLTDFKKRSEYEVTMTNIGSRIHEALRNKNVKAFIEGENELDVEDMVKNGESLIINLRTSNDFVKIFLANIIVGAISSYISLEKKINPLFVYIDEFDLVASGMFSKTLQLSRSSLVGFTLAHQNFSSAKSEYHNSMMKNLISSILACVSNYLVFNTSPMVAKEMCDVFNLKVPDFTELDIHEARLRLGIKKLYIQTKLPMLSDVPDNFIFPSSDFIDSSVCTLDFLSDEWIML